MYKMCKTEQSAVRQRELELALSDMMKQQRYEEITVSEFCSHVGIPRKAFYRYFSSKDGALYALIDHTLLEFERYRVPGAGERDHSILLELESFYKFWLTQKSILDALEFSGLSGVIFERTISAGEASAAQKRCLTGESEFVYRQMTRFALSGIMTMMMNWHHEGYRESPREMAELTFRMITQPLLPVLQGLM